MEACLGYIFEVQKGFNETWFIDRWKLEGRTVHKNLNPTLYIYWVISP